MTIDLLPAGNSEKMQTRSAERKFHAIGYIWLEEVICGWKRLLVALQSPECVESNLPEFLVEPMHD
jgi:hypothetical protein